jgi:hypothetical protein
MKIRAVKIFFSILSKLILNQNGFLLSKIFNDFGLRNFDSGFLLSYVNEQLKPGRYEVEFDGSGYASGVYFYTLIVGDAFYEPTGSKNRRSAPLSTSFTQTNKMILLK